MERIYQYEGDAVHAVTDAGSNSYNYDENGNQTHRLVHTIINGQPVTQEFEMGYDSENRLVSVTGVNGTTMSTLFTYNGDGQKVKSEINGETIYLVNGYFEKKGSEITKYYFAGASRVAMRKYTIPQNMTVEYMLGDHLGSTSITTDTAGSMVSEMRYSPWGEVRYHWVDENLSTTPAYKLPVYTFTGQRSYMDDPSTSGVDGFGLLDYNARMYDPQVGRFASADTVVPGGVQGLDRYAYVNNSPVRYTDPSGHDVDCGIGDSYCDELRQEYYHSWLPSARTSSFDTYLEARDAYYFYNAHPDVALQDMFAQEDTIINSWEDVDSYTLASIYSENVMHQYFNPVPDDLIIREIDKARASGKPVDRRLMALVSGMALSQWLQDNYGNNGSAMRGNFPETSNNSHLYRVDASGNITNFAVYDDAGRIIFRVDLVGKPHNGIPTPHIQYAEWNTDPIDGQVYLNGWINVTSWP